MFARVHKDMHKWFVIDVWGNLRRQSTQSDDISAPPSVLQRLRGTSPPLRSTASLPQPSLGAWNPNVPRITLTWRVPGPRPTIDHTVNYNGKSPVWNVGKSNIKGWCSWLFMPQHYCQSLLFLFTIWTCCRWNLSNCKHCSELNKL